MPSRLTPITRISALAPIAPAAPLQLASLLASMTLRTTRSASLLASLRDAPGATHNLKRVGRGPSSGHGRTSGRGMNGQKVHGKVKPWFQGGQTPLIISRGTKGFDNICALKLSPVNLDSLQHWIDTGRLDPAHPITPKELIQSGLVGSIKDGIKLLGRGKETLRTPVILLVSRASAEAITAVEAAGGRVTTRYFTRDSIRNLILERSEASDKPLAVGAEHVEAALEDAKKRPWLKRLPDPTHRWDVEYYRDPAHRGYLSHMLKEGNNPSLFFGVPKDKQPKKEKKKTASGPAKAKVEKDDLLF